MQDIANIGDSMLQLIVTLVLNPLLSYLGQIALNVLQTGADAFLSFFTMQNAPFTMAIMFILIIVLWNISNH